MKTFLKTICLFSIFTAVNLNASTRTNIEPYESESLFSATSKLDQAVQSGLKKQGLQSTYISSDTVFARRLYLDLFGRIPSVKELYAFIDSKKSNKRCLLIEELLASDEFSVYMTFRWSDIFKIKAEFPINLWPNAAQAYNKFILDSLIANKPYDKIAYEMMTSSGSNFRVGSVNFYRALQGRGTDITSDALCSAFLGIDFTKLEEDKAKNLEKFFTKIAYKATKEWKEEIVYHDFANLEPIETSFIDGKKVYIKGEDDPRLALAELVIANEYFAKNFVNRAFGRLMGKYIIQNPDDILNSKNTNPELLDYLANFFIKNNYDIRKLYAEILNSNTYQQSSIALIEKEGLAENFAIYTPRQTEAEVLIDIICDITNTAEVYSSMIPEPYTAMPMYIKSISIPDGSISTGFLDLFGKSQRDTGKELERKSRPSASQRMHLLNSTHIRNKIESMAKSFANLTDANMDKAIRYLYVKILSREETAGELERIKRYKKENKMNNLTLFTDTIWALMNSEEFINKH
ncbi:MAG: DUF1553 domain-containing protein [Opitutales bacterium]